MVKARDTRAAYFRDIPVLVYHKVQPGVELGVTTVHPRVFRKHIQWISQHTNYVPNADNHSGYGVTS